MPNLQWIVVCEYALRDSANKLSILGEFTSMKMPKFPAQLPSMYIVTRWTAEVEGEQFSFAEQIKITDSEGNLIAGSGPAEVSLEQGRRVTSMRKFEFVPFDKPGTYFVEVYWEGEFKGKDHFFVRSQ